MTDENIIVRAARAQREVWETIEQQDAEIERLRAQVAFLLPFAKADAELGATLGPHPNDEYDDCADCQWFEQSMELLQKIEAGEFG